MAYATNREVKFKLDVPNIAEAEEKRANSNCAKLYVSKLRHNGGWNVAPSALSNLMKTVCAQVGLRISTDQQAIAAHRPAHLRLSPGLHARPQQLSFLAG